MFSRRSSSALTIACLSFRRYAMGADRSMRTLIWTVVLVIFAGVLCALPLFDLLGYEFSFAMALAVTVAAIDLGRVKIPRSPSGAAGDDARPLLGMPRRGAALAAIAVAALFLDGSDLGLRARAARRRSPLFAGLAVAAALALGLAGGRLGFARSAEDIARALGGEKRTQHFVLHYSPSGPFA